MDALIIIFIKAIRIIFLIFAIIIVNFQDYLCH